MGLRVEEFAKTALSSQMFILVLEVLSRELLKRLPVHTLVRYCPGFYSPGGYSGVVREGQRGGQMPQAALAALREAFSV